MEEVKEQLGHGTEEGNKGEASNTQKMDQKGCRTGLKQCFMAHNPGEEKKKREKNEQKFLKLNGPVYNSSMCIRLTLGLHPKLLYQILWTWEPGITIFQKLPW